MIGALFRFGGDVIEVRVVGEKVLFRTTGASAGAFATIEGLKLSKGGVIKEFPDLKDNENWREEAIKRFKEKMKKMNGEDERIQYVINDLKKFGYVPMYLQKQGFRAKKIK